MLLQNATAVRFLGFALAVDFRKFGPRRNVFLTGN
jgi:hypothetical protein